MTDQGGPRLPWKIQTLFKKKVAVVVDEGDEESANESSHKNDGHRHRDNDHDRYDDSDDDDDDDGWEEVKCADSVRSLSSTSRHYNNSGSIGSRNKIQRTHSSSTIDSNDVDGAGKIIGVSSSSPSEDCALEHVVMPTDTLQGICIAYKVHPTALRRANHFSGNNLMLAPKKLIIPAPAKRKAAAAAAAIGGGARQRVPVAQQDTTSKEYKINSLQAEVKELSTAEATAYLELSDWNLKDAVQSAKEDSEWEHDIDDGLQAGQQIRITMKNKGLFPCTLLGIQPGWCSRSSSKSGKNTNDNNSKICKVNDHPEEEEEERKPKPAKVKVHNLPAIATKTVQPQDLYRAAPQHNNFGFELKSLR